MTGPAEVYAYQRLVWPRAGGDLIDDRLLPLPSEIDPSTFLDYFQTMFGEPIETANTDADGERVAVGWVFRAPPEFDVAADGQDLEVVIMPVVPDPEDPDAYVNFFIAQADAKSAFLAAMSESGVPTTIATVHQRAIGDELDVELSDEDESD